MCIAMLFNVDLIIRLVALIIDQYLNESKK